MVTAALKTGLRPELIYRLVAQHQAREDWAVQLKIFVPNCQDGSETQSGTTVDTSKCVVCGFTRQGERRFAGYPGEGVTFISRAHILKTRAQANTLGVPFDSTNYLPLCGTFTRGQVSCHNAFDTYRLCFTELPESRHMYRVHTHSDCAEYRALHGHVVDLSGQRPHRTCLHGHAMACFLNSGVTPFEEKFENLNRTPPLLTDAEPALGGGVAVKPGGSRRLRHRPSPTCHQCGAGAHRKDTDGYYYCERCFRRWGKQHMKPQT